MSTENNWAEYRGVGRRERKCRALFLHLHLTLSLGNTGVNKYLSSRDTQYLNMKNMKRKCKNKSSINLQLFSLFIYLGFATPAPQIKEKLQWSCNILFIHRIFLSWNVSHWTSQTNVKNIPLGSVELWFTQWGMTWFAFYTSRLGTAYMSHQQY